MSNFLKTVTTLGIFFLLSVYAIVINSCTNEGAANPTPVVKDEVHYEYLKGVDFYRSGMHYVEIRESFNGGLFIINITKDSLEVANMIEVNDSTNDK